MGKWSLGDIGMTIGTGGMYGVYKGIRDDQNEKAQENYNKYTNDLYGQNKQNYDSAMNMGKDLENKLYGNLGNTVGSSAEKYMGALEKNIGTDAIQSDLYRQKQDYNISRANAKAGLAGVDTTSGKMQEDRNASMQAKAINQDYQNKALAQYGQAVGATQNAMANLWLGTMGMALGSQQQAQPLQQKGFLSELLT